MKAPKLCPAEPLELNLDRVLGQARRAVTAGEFAADNGADHAVDVLDRQGGARPFRCVPAPARTV